MEDVDVQYHHYLWALIRWESLGLHGTIWLIVNCWEEWQYYTYQHIWWLETFHYSRHVFALSTVAITHGRTTMKVSWWQLLNRSTGPKSLGSSYVERSLSSWQVTLYLFERASSSSREYCNSFAKIFTSYLPDCYIGMAIWKLFWLGVKEVHGVVRCRISHIDELCWDA